MPSVCCIPHRWHVCSLSSHWLRNYLLQSKALPSPSSSLFARCSGRMNWLDILVRAARSLSGSPTEGPCWKLRHPHWFQRSHIWLEHRPARKSPNEGTKLLIVLDTECNENIPLFIFIVLIPQQCNFNFCFNSTVCLLYACASIFAYVFSTVIHHWYCLLRAAGEWQIIFWQLEFRNNVVNLVAHIKGICDFVRHIPFTFTLGCCLFRYTQL